MVVTHESVDMPWYILSPYHIVSEGTSGTTNNNRYVQYTDHSVPNGRMEAGGASITIITVSSSRSRISIWIYCVVLNSHTGGREYDVAIRPHWMVIKIPSHCVRVAIGSSITLTMIEVGVGVCS